MFLFCSVSEYKKLTFVCMPWHFWTKSSLPKKWELWDKPVFTETYPWNMSKPTNAIFGIKCVWSFPGGSVGKESTCNAGDLGSIPGWRVWQPTPVFLPGEPPWTEEPGYSPWGHKESDTTERLSTVFDHTHALFHVCIFSEEETTLPDIWEKTAKVGSLVVW